MTKDGPPEPPGEGPPRRKFYPPPPRVAPSNPTPLDYRDKREKQPRERRYRRPGPADKTDLPLGLLIYFVPFVLYLSWQGRDLRFAHVLEVAGVLVVLSVALGVATRRWGITVGVVIAALLSLGGCGLLSTLCDPFGRL